MASARLPHDKHCGRTTPNPKPLAGNRVKAPKATCPLSSYPAVFPAYQDWSPATNQQESIARRLRFAFARNNLLGHLRRRLDNQRMLMRMDPLLQLVQFLALTALNLPHQDRLAPVDLVNDIVDHDAGLVALELAGLEVLKRPLNRPSTVVFPLRTR